MSRDSEYVDGEMSYQTAWNELRDLMREEKKQGDKDRDNYAGSGHDPGPPTIAYITLLNIMVNLKPI